MKHEKEIFRACGRDAEKTAVRSEGERAPICSQHLDRLSDKKRASLTLVEPKKFERCVFEVCEKKWVEVQKQH